MKLAASIQAGQATKAPASETGQRREKLRETCAEFEALLLQNVLKSMRATIPESGLLEKDASRDMYADILDIQVARGIALENGGTGIGDTLYRQMQKLETGSSD